MDLTRINKDFFKAFRLGDAGFLDTCEIEGNSLLLDGWSVLKNEPGLPVPKKIHVVYDDCLLGEIDNFSKARPDVAQAFPGFPERCGFSQSIPWPGGKFDPVMLELFAEADNSNRYQLHKDQKYTFLFQLEPTGKCNLRCAQCPNTIYSGFNNLDVTQEDIDICLPLIRKSSTICYDGFGEFFLSKNIHLAVEKTPLRTHVLIHTNGMLADQYIDFLLQNSPPIRQLIFSLDSLRKERYALIRQGGDLERVLANMEELKRRRDMAGQTLPYIVPNMKIMNINIDELRAFIDLAAHFDGYLELVYLYDAQKLDAPVSGDECVDEGLLGYTRQQPRFHMEDVAKAIQDAEEYAAAQNVVIIWSGALPEAVNGNIDEHDYIGTRRPISECPMAECSTAMQLDGKIMFCVWQTSPLFNWRKEGKVDLSTHPRAIQARDMMKRNEIPFECDGSFCQFVGRQRSKEKKQSEAFVGGGW